MDILNGSKYRIDCGDCLDWLRALPDSCVDLVVCSPPYEAARTYGIDFNLRGQEWVDWAVERFVECVRVSKGLVVWVVEGQTRKFRWSATPALFMADLHRRGVHLRKPPIFHRVGIPGSGGPDYWRNDYEFCVVGAKGGKLLWSENTATGHIPKYAPGGTMSYRMTDGQRVNQWGASLKSTGRERKKNGELPIPDGPKPWHQIKTRRDKRIVEKLSNGAKMHTKSNADGSDAVQRYLPPAIANPGNVIKVKVGGGLLGSDLAHENEAPYPESLVEPFVRCFCPPSGIVLDPFSGSGTTAAVALKWSRRFLGCDVRQSQVDLTKRRIAEVQPMLIS